MKHTLLPWLAVVLGAGCGKPESTADASAAAESATRPASSNAAPVDSGQGRVDPWAEAKARGIDFRALGQEPGWYLEIDDGARMTLVVDYGERRIEMAAPAPVVDSGGLQTTYVARSATHSLQVFIRAEPQARPCRDGMSGLTIGSTVTVELDSTTYRGCGRRLR